LHDDYVEDCEDCKQEAKNAEEEGEYLKQQCIKSQRMAHK
jgi:hypothetical protein